MEPNTITFYNTLDNQNIEVLRISPAGITANPAIPVDEAADAVLRAVDAGIKQMMQLRKRERVVFPTMLRKMWSGGEVQAWLDENVNNA